MFQRRPQNSDSVTEISGQFINGFASTPTDRQKHDSRWKVPKCSTITIPTIPTQPTRYGSRSFNSGTTRYNTASPVASLAEAKSHSASVGGLPELRRKAGASRPGQANR